MFVAANFHKAMRAASRVAISNENKGPFDVRVVGRLGQCLRKAAQGATTFAAQSPVPRRHGMVSGVETSP